MYEVGVRSLGKCLERLSDDDGIIDDDDIGNVNNFNSCYS